MLKQSNNSKPSSHIEIIKGEGAFFWDTEDNKYIDMSCQTMNLLLGQCHPEVNQAIMEQLNKLSFTDQGFVCSAYGNAIGLLQKILPHYFDIINLRMSDGSGAVECAIKMATNYSGKGGILTVQGIYLGQNNHTIKIRGWGERRNEILCGMQQKVIHALAPVPDYEKNFTESRAENGEEISCLIESNKDKLGCIILDPVMISEGITHGRGMNIFIGRAIKAAKRYDIPVILDECQTFGWVPDITLTKHFEYEPDILVLGKCIGGGLPLSACVTTKKFDNLQWGDADYTNGGTLPAIAALAKTCEILQRGETRLHFAKLSLILDRWSDRINTECWPKITVRGIGLIRAINIRIGKNRYDNISLVKRLVGLFLDHGIYLRGHNDSITIKLPLVIETEYLEEGLSVIEKELRRCLC